MSKLSLRRPSAEPAEPARPNREVVAVVREAERLKQEPEADFFVSMPRSKKAALKSYCALHNLSMRDWLLLVMEEKGIGVEGATPVPPPAKRNKTIGE